MSNESLSHVLGSAACVGRAHQPHWGAFHLPAAFGLNTLHDASRVSESPSVGRIEHLPVTELVLHEGFADRHSLRRAHQTEGRVYHDQVHQELQDYPSESRHCHRRLHRRVG